MPLSSTSSPLVTVVTPSLNQGRFLRATIESVLSQDYPALEYIVMDGGSTDESASIAREYASRLTFVCEKDRGQSHAINKGFRLARGEIVSYLNSDDLLLPGAIRAGVDALSRNGAAGAVYGEGFLIDLDGKSLGRFPHTRPPDVWTLVHLSDYILQQSVFFRRRVLEEIGYLDESLHWTMDWDVLIRIALRYPLCYAPTEMGCLRVYPETKTGLGGLARVVEIRDLLRRHSGRSVPPGAVVYALDTLSRSWSRRLDGMGPGLLRAAAGAVDPLVQGAVRALAGRVVTRAQGRYPDGWAAATSRFILPPGRGAVALDGSLPGWCPVRGGQRVRVDAGRRSLGTFDLPEGDFRLRVPVPGELSGSPLELSLTARRSFPLEPFRIGWPRRKGAFLLHDVRWDADPKVHGPDA